jgi:phenylpropionate dioxygenase-like ring-hydroxylating dioxygenase large terminal subunit
MMFTHEEIDEAAEALARGWSLPYAWMGDPELTRFDKDALFARSWQAIGLERDITEPGARLVDVVGRVPVLVIRGGDGELRAFANVCRHRGYPVAPSSGCEKVLQCRYHAWTYNFDGTLRKAPGAEAEPGFETGELGLKPLACHVWRGVVFVNGDPDCEPFEAVFPRVEEEAAAVDLDLRRYTFHSRITATPACDWKLFYDNIVECYHCPTMHGQSLNSRYDSQAFAAVEWEGPMRVGHTSIKRVDPAGAPSHHTIQMFPGIVILQDRFIAQVCRFAPGDAGTTRFVCDYLVNPDEDPEITDEYVDLWNLTFAEDREIVAQQQEAIASGVLERGRLMTVREDSVPGVQALILQAYRRAVANGSRQPAPQAAAR